MLKNKLNAMGLIVVRVQENQNKTLRLGFFSSNQTKKRTKQPATELEVFIECLSIRVNDNMLEKYNNYGSLIDQQIHDWINKQNLKKDENVLIEADFGKTKDVLRIIGAESVIKKAFTQADAKKRKRND